MNNRYNVIFSVLFILVVAFQNCARVQFGAFESNRGSSNQASSEPITAQSVSTVCDESLRPIERIPVNCVNGKEGAFQNFEVRCEDGEWVSQLKDSDFSACEVCPAEQKPSTKGAVSCLAPYGSSNLGVQNYSVTCTSQGQWAQVLSGPPDYSACPKSCDEGQKPNLAEACSLVIPQTTGSIISYYATTCDSSTGLWNKALNSTGTSEYQCQCSDPQSTFSVLQKTCIPKSTIDTFWGDCPNASYADSSSWRCEVYVDSRDRSLIPSIYFSSDYTFTNYMTVSQYDPQSALASQVSGGVVNLNGTQLSKVTLIRSYQLFNNPVGKNVYAAMDVKDLNGNVVARYWRKIKINP